MSKNWFEIYGSFIIGDKHYDGKTAFGWHIENIDDLWIIDKFVYITHSDGRQIIQSINNDEEYVDSNSDFFPIIGWRERRDE